MKTNSKKILSVFLSLLMTFMCMTSVVVQSSSQMILHFADLTTSAGQDVQLDLLVKNPIAIKEMSNMILTAPDGFEITGMSETSPAFNGSVTYQTDGKNLNFSIKSNGTVSSENLAVSIYMHVSESCANGNYAFQWKTMAMSCIKADGYNYTPTINYGIVTVGDSGNTTTTTSTAPQSTTTTTNTTTTTTQTTTTATTTTKKYTYSVRFVDEETNQAVSGVKYNIRSYYTYDPVQVVQTSGDTPKSYEFISDTAYVSLTKVEQAIPDGYYIPDGAERWELSADNPDLTVYLRKSETTTTTETTTTETTTTETTTAVTGGMCGNNVSWKYESGTLTISGTGEMDNYDYKNETYAPWHDLRENIENVIIEDGLNNIGEHSFYEYTSIKSVTLPDSIERIENGAFYGCNSLTSISIPDSITSLGNGAFENCTSLETITIPEKLTEISYKAFKNTKWLENKQKENPFVIVNGVLIDSTTCSSDVVIPDEVKIIGEGAFRECNSIISVTISENVTAIKLMAFTKCDSLKSVTILNPYCEIFDGSLTISNYIDSEAAYFNGTIYGYENSTAQTYAENCEYNFSSLGKAPAVNQSGVCGDNLTWKLENNTLTVSGSGDMYDYNDINSNTQWDNYRNDIKNIIIENGVTSIGASAFPYCDSLVSVTIPESVTAINNDAFCNCKSLESVTILNPDCKINGSNGTISNSADTITHILEFKGTIYGYENSEAQAYAEKYNYNFSVLGQETTTTTQTTTTTTTETTTTTTAPSYANIYINSLPYKTVYEIGEELDFNGGVASANGQTDGISWDIFNEPFTSSNFILDTSEFDNTKAGTYKIYIYPNNREAKAEFEVTVVEKTETINLGDVNNDGFVDSVDSSMVLTEYALLSTSGIGEFTDNQKKSADLNNDGITDSVDASLILSYYAYVSTNGSDTLETWLTYSLTE